MRRPAHFVLIGPRDVVERARALLDAHEEAPMTARICGMLWGGLVLSVLSLPATEVLAQSEGPWQWEADVGYGYGIDISSHATFLGDVRFVGVAARLGRPVGDRFLEESWLEGRVQLMGEVPLWVSLEPERGFAAGATLVPRYTFGESAALRPFAEAGVGPIYLHFNNERSQADGVSFTLQVGGGVMYSVAPGWAVALRGQLHHISNAGLRSPNPGINDLLFTLGVVRAPR